MAQLAVFIAGLLLTTESQASDVAQADPSEVQGFLSQYMTAPTQRSWTSVIDNKPAFTPAKEVMDAHLTEHTMIEMAISSMAVVHQVYSSGPCPNLWCRAKGAYAEYAG